MAMGPITAGAVQMLRPATTFNRIANLRHYAHPKGGYKAPRAAQGRAMLPRPTQAVNRPPVHVSATQRPPMVTSALLGIPGRR